MRALIAEDNTDVRDALVIALEKEGWEVFAAKDGRDALRVYHNAIEHDQYFDLLLLDVRMPRLNGIAVGVNVRNLEKFAKIPRACHVYLTGQGDIVEPESLTDNAFADAYLRKPIHGDELIKQIEKLVKKGVK